MNQAGKSWLITGASSGFGEALVREVVARGGNAAAAARNPADVARLVALAPDRVMALPLDVTRADQIQAAVTATEKRFGKIDVLVNNAGYGLLAAVEEASDAQVRHQYEVNLLGPAALMRAVLPSMRKRGIGLVINISSIGGTHGMAGAGYYCSSKAALEALTEALASEGAALGIRGMIVEPGPFRTDFSDRSIKLAEREIEDYGAARETRQRTADGAGRQPGDPRRAAKLIVDTAEESDPPLRLVLGKSAFEIATRAFRNKLTDMERSRKIAPLADFT